MDLSSPIISIPGIGPTIAGKLGKLGIKSVFDFLYHLPFRYEDRSRISTVKNLRVGETATLLGQIDGLKSTVTKTGKYIQAGSFSDATGSVTIIFFHQPFLTHTLKKGTPVALYGKCDFFGNKLALISPEYELIQKNLYTSPALFKEGDNPAVRDGGVLGEVKDYKLTNMARIIPVYPETAGISSKWLRTKMHNLLPKPDTPDILPPEIISQFHLFPWSKSLNEIHFPTKIIPISSPALVKEGDNPAVRDGRVLTNSATTERFKNRLAFDELLLLQLTTLLRREKWQHTRLAHTFQIDSQKVNHFITSLPFSLTKSQETAIGEILHDLASKEAMNRLLEGDVGSGKTVVAAIAALVAHLNGFQTIFLAPTQILAQQHYATFQKLFKDLKIKTKLVLGNKRTSPLSPSLIKEGDTPQGEEVPSVFIGTHALLTDKVKTDNIGLVIIDEQHRFGVTQRALAAKKGTTPHILTMTATPIPRSIALTMYGDLDLSVLTDVPTGRLPVKTWIVPENKRQDAYKWIKDQLRTPPTSPSLIKEGDTRQGEEVLTGDQRLATNQALPAGRQVFIVCPFIKPSETLTSIKSATAEFEKLQQIFSEFKLGLLHGRLKSDEKDQVINRFRAGDYQILVATPVVEVGLDIPNATIMVIESADRFGLAQLHQLRGRVGRSNQQSYCFLFADKDVSRLNEMQTHFSGLELAEIDLKLRGPGEIYGTAQHGIDILKVAQYTDLGLISRAREAANLIFPRLNSLPTLRHLLNQDKIDVVLPN